MKDNEAIFNVEYYEKKKGEFPAEDFILGQDVKMRAKLFKLLELLESKGNELREPYSKHLDDGIYEIRAIQSNNITRVLYFFAIERKIILTHGFVKKTKKTPPQEISRAKEYRDDYYEQEKKKKEKEQQKNG